MARFACSVAFAAAVFAALVLTPSYAQDDEAGQQIINSIIIDVNYCVGNASNACPSLSPLFTAVNISNQIQGSGSSSADSPTGGPAPAPSAYNYSGCYDNLPSVTSDNLLYNINPALVLPFCNNTKCLSATDTLDTCIGNVFDAFSGQPDSSADTSGDNSTQSNNPQVLNDMQAFCANPTCVTLGKALSPPSSPPASLGSATTTQYSLLAGAALSLIVVGVAL